jgi:hypothetical protein
MIRDICEYTLYLSLNVRFFYVIRTEFRKSMNITVSTNLHTTVNESTQYCQNLSLSLSLSLSLFLSLNVRFLTFLTLLGPSSGNITVSTNLHTTINKSTQYCQNLSTSQSLSINQYLNQYINQYTFFDFFDVIRTEFREYHSFYKPTHNSQ